MAKKTVKTLGESLHELLAQLGIEKRVNQFRVIELWPSIVGEKISKISRAERVDDEILYIKVATTGWRTELLFHKQKILKNIEEKVGKNVIKDIRFY